ncbi:MAG: hypothetical protein VX899_16695 [Myxococcota bacterium]|nr:hypothetical protein [Myxococcota bacterium]
MILWAIFGCSFGTPVELDTAQAGGEVLGLCQGDYDTSVAALGQPDAALASLGDRYVLIEDDSLLTLETDSESVSAVGLTLVGDECSPAWSWETVATLDSLTMGAGVFEGHLLHSEELSYLQADMEVPVDDYSCGCFRRMTAAILPDGQPGQGEVVQYCRTGDTCEDIVEGRTILQW